MEVPPPSAPASADAPVPAQGAGKRKLALVGGIILVGLLLCCCLVLAAGALVWFDPFGWNLLGFLKGGQDPLAQAAPAEALLYVSVDTLQLASPNTQRVLSAFADTPAGADLADPNALYQKLDEFMAENMGGLTFSDDIQPWLGQYLSLVVTEMEPGSYSAQTQSEFVLMFQVRDARAAEAFAFRLAETLAAKNNIPFENATYQNVTYLHQPNPDGQPTLIAESKSILLLSNSPAALEAVIDTQKGNAEALSSVSEYKDLRAKLPASALAVYVTSRRLDDLVQMGQQNLTQSGMPMTYNAGQLGSLRGMALGLNTVSAGIRLDMVIAYDESQLTDLQRQALQTKNTDQNSRRLPENTVIYFNSNGLATSWTLYRDNLLASAGEAAFNESMAAFEKTLGFNPDTDLFPYLTGEFALAVLPDSESFLTQLNLGDLGFALLSDVSDETAVNRTLTAFNTALEASGGSTTSAAQTFGEVEGYLAVSADAPLAAYGVGQNQLFIASSAAVATDLFNGAPALADADRYQKAWAGPLADTSHALFVDVTGVSELLRAGMETEALAEFEGQTLPYLEPIELIAAGARPMQKGILTSTVVVFIDAPVPED